MGILKNVFGNKAAMDAAKGVGKFIDEQQLTDEEKAENKKELAKITIDHIKSLEPYKLAQRYLVTIVAAVWAVLALSLIVVAIIDNQVIFDNLMHLAGTDIMTWPTSAVFLVWLGGGLANSVRGKK